MGHIKAKIFIPPHKRQGARLIAHLEAQQKRFAHGKIGPHFLSGATTELDFVLRSNNGVAATPSDQVIFDFTIYLNDPTQCSGNANNGYTCTFVAPAPVGTDGYSVYGEQCSVPGSTSSASCSSLGGSLTTLGAAYASVFVPLNTVVVIAFTLSPVVGSIDWAPVTYSNLPGPTPYSSNLWLVDPNGPNVPKYQPTPSPGIYSCTRNVGSGTGNGCYEPVAQGAEISYGVVLEVRDPTGALIVPTSNGGAIYQTPIYVDANGLAITIDWTCYDSVTGGNSLTWETGGGPYSDNSQATLANESINSPVVNPASDPDGGNTTDANGNPVTAVGNNGVEMSWDGMDQPLLHSPNHCTAWTSNGLRTTLDWYAGLGEGGVTLNTPSPSPSPSVPIADGTVYVANSGGNPNVGPAAGKEVLGFAPGNDAGPPTTDVTTMNSGSYLTAGTMTMDSSGDLWIATLGSDILEFGPTANGNAVPVRTITPSISVPGGYFGIAIDGSGEVFGAQNNSQGQIDVYGLSSTPIRSFTANGLGPATKLDFDPQGNLWAAGETVLAEYPATATGSTTATTSILSIVNGNGTLAGCNIDWPFQPRSIAFDPQGNLYVATISAPQGGAIVKFSPPFGPSSCPSAYLHTTNPVLDFAVDDKAHIYAIAGSSMNEIDLYSETQMAPGYPTDFGSTAIVTPQSTIVGPQTLLNGPTAIAAWSNPAFLTGNQRRGSTGIHRGAPAKSRRSIGVPNR